MYNILIVIKPSIIVKFSRPETNSGLPSPLKNLELQRNLGSLSSSNRFSRHDETILSRLRINHIHLIHTFLFLFMPVPPSQQPVRAIFLFMSSRKYPSLSFVYDYKTLSDFHFQSFLVLLLFFFYLISFRDVE